MDQRKENYAQKRIYSAFMRGTEEVRDDTNNWFWMKEQELFMAEQDQLLQTRWVKHSIDRTNGSPKCRMCGKMDENVSHVVSECNKLAQNEYKKLRHDKIAALLHWQWCQDLWIWDAWENNMPKISCYNIFYFLKYAHSIHVKQSEKIEYV